MKRAVASLLAICLAVLALTGTALASVIGGSVGAPGGELRAGAPIPPNLVPIIEAAGSTCPDVTPALLASQLRHESGFRANALSSAGAEGIAQFLPGTWPTWGRDENGDGMADPFDPADAIPADARMLCSLVARARASSLPGDRVALALAGYNAGWGAVLRYHGVPPYPQTERYVQAVLAGLSDFEAVATGTVAARTAVAFAYAQLGTPYTWGGESSLGYDCSGLTQAAWAAAGVHLPRTSREQWNAGLRVDQVGLQPGDLVFFATDVTDSRTIHHVGVYVGGGHMIDAPHTGALVRIEPVLDEPGYIGATRPG